MDTSMYIRTSYVYTMRLNFSLRNPKVVDSNYKRTNVFMNIAKALERTNDSSIYMLQRIYGRFGRTIDVSTCHVKCYHYAGSGERGVAQRKLLET